MSPRNLHYLSGIIITLFAALHLYNHICAIEGAVKHIQVMDSFRLIYRNVVAESILMVTIAIQIVTGIRFFRASRKTASTGFEKLHIWTGLYLAFFFVVHVSAIMAGRTILDLDTNFYFGAAGLNTFPFYIFFVPYYFLAIMALFGHIAAMHSKKMRLTIWSFSPENQSKIILAIGFLVAVAVLYGMTNQFHGVEIPEEYHKLLGK